MKSRLYTIFGGQFGSEGKGEIAALITKLYGLRAAVRIGGPNAGHTGYVQDKDGVKQKVVVRTVPFPVMSGVPGYIGPEGMINVEVLRGELLQAYELTGLPATLYVDGCAGLVLPRHIGAEVGGGLTARIGSTAEGVGACTVDKTWRLPDVIVREHDNLQRLRVEFSGPEFDVDWNADTVTDVNEILENGGNVLIEGTQGYGLSLHTGGYYPFCTSRECTPQALWAGTGVNPKNADDAETVMVIRTYPIRVGGNSGPMFEEVEWEWLSKQTGGYVKEPEKTTVTKRNRRIGMFDTGLLSRAVLQTRPDVLAVTFLDYKFPRLAGMSAEAVKQDKDAMKWLRYVEFALNVPVRYICTGPGCSSALY